MPKGQHKYSGEQKVEIVERMHREHLGIVETAQMYGIYHKRIFDWERIYLQEGKEGLLLERRGRPKTPRKTDFTPEQENDLLAQVQQLRMENEYLKKLNALILKEEQKNRKRK